MIDSPTRSTRLTASLIDLIFVKNKDFLSKAGVLDYNVSDHDLIYAVLKKPCVPRPKVSFTVRTLKNYSIAILYHKLSSVDWSTYYENRDPTCWQQLLETYIKILDEIAPFIDHKQYDAREEWIDDNSLNLIKKRNKLRAQCRYQADNKTFEKYKEARNKARQAIDNARASN